MTVVPHRPWQRAVIYLSAAIVLIVSLWFAYRTGFERGADNLAELDLAHAQGVSDVQRAARQVAELRAALLVAERNQQVDEQVNAQAQASIVDLRRRIVLLERDVALYRQVMALEAETPAIKVQSWQLSSTELPNHYRYRLILSHTGANGGELTGKLQMAVTGTLMPRPTPMGDQQEGQQDSQTVEFTELVDMRYLQVLEGDLRLPPGFSAEHVRLEFSADTPSPLQFSDNMPWQPQGEN
ncbi:MAG: hypothetical protein CMQ34_05585 [Gammaproteobacteria bacterium]|nr:hypothetical protein [Gammaproteobacteria bacterium]